jgi:alginate O-acetyltransferase complex protein AlgI
MLFNSIPFIFVFLPTVLVGFYLLGWLNRPAAQLWLCAASFFFYGYWNPIYLPLLAGSLLANYFFGRILKNPRYAPSVRKVLLTIGILCNLGVLGYFKYAMFFAANTNAVVGTDWIVPNIILPIGISFITFQKIGYLVDVYRKPTQFDYSLREFALFVTFFPQLIAGPIVRHHEILPQFRRPSVYRPDPTRFAIGLSIFFLALFKKTVFADGFAGIATPVFRAADSGHALTFGDAWLGALAFTLQLYFDFSAYSEMAAALAIMFGVRLPINFASPYKATSVVDFWRRWHISLSRFLRDYLYVPLGGNRRGSARRALNVMVTMVLGGLWHGAGWTFVIWGALHGVYIVINQFWRQFFPGRKGSTSFAWIVVAWFVTFLAVVCGWVFFRATTVQSAAEILGAMANPYSGTVSVFDRPGVLAVLAVLGGLGFVLLAPNIPTLFEAFQPMLKEGAQVPVEDPPVRPVPARALRWEPTTPWAFAVGFSAIAGLVAMVFFRAQSEFLYFQF